MGKMKQLLQEAERNNGTEFFATKDPLQVLLLESVHKQKSIGWMSKGDDLKRYVIFDQNSEVSRHISLWESILGNNLGYLELLNRYLYEMLDESSVVNYNIAFTSQEPIDEA